jgi:hypothetical protein
MFLFCIVVLACADYFHPQRVPIEPKTVFRVFHHNRCVINSQEQFVFALPFWIALALRELEDFEEVPIGISEIEGLDASCIFVPIGQTLTSGLSHR